MEIEKTHTASRDAWRAHVNNRLVPLLPVVNGTSMNETALSLAHYVGLVELDEAIKATQTIRSSINNLALPCRLPDEVLSHIFALLGEVYRPRAASSGGKVALGWVCILHVCRRWREVARGCSQLWTSLELVLGFRWMDEFIALSRSRPLAIDRMPTKTKWRHPDSKVLDMVDNALQLPSVLERLETLDIYNKAFLPNSYRCMLLLQTLSSLAPGSLPRLQTLSLCTPVKAPLPVPLLASIRDLTLSDMLIDSDTPWSAFPDTFRSLHFLQWSKGIGRSTSYDLAGLLPFIARCSNLLTLELYPVFVNSMPISDKISLPTLRSLNLRGRQTAVTSLLQAFTSLSTILTLKLDISDAAKSTDLLSIAEIISGMQCVCVPYKTLSLKHFVRCSDSGNFRGGLALSSCIQDTTTPLARAERAKGASLALRMSYFGHADQDFAQRFNLVDAFLRTSNTSNVQTLMITGLHASPGVWKQWFGGVRTPRRLILKKAEALAFVRALGLPTSEALMLASAEEVMFPDLRTLSIRLASFSGVIAPALDPGHAAAILRRTLASRLTVNCVPRDLTLHDCTVDIGEVQTWVNAVPLLMRDWTLDSLQQGIKQ